MRRSDGTPAGRLDSPSVRSLLDGVPTSSLRSQAAPSSIGDGLPASLGYREPSVATYANGVGDHLPTMNIVTGYGAAVSHTLTMGPGGGGRATATDGGIVRGGSNLLATMAGGSAPTSKSGQPPVVTCSDGPPTATGFSGGPSTAYGLIGDADLNARLTAMQSMMTAMQAVILSQQPTTSANHAAVAAAMHPPQPRPASTTAAEPSHYRPRDMPAAATALTMPSPTSGQQPVTVQLVMPDSGTATHGGRSGRGRGRGWRGPGRDVHPGRQNPVRAGQAAPSTAGTQ